MIIVTTSEMQHNFDKYLSLVMSGQEILVTQNGQAVGRFVPQNTTTSYLTDSLLGILKDNSNWDTIRTENVDSKQMGNVQTAEMKITAYELQHGDCKPILGFTLEKDDKTIGYATDTTLCDNVKKICEKSDCAFLDATRMNATNSHMGLEDVINISEEFPNKKIYAIHRNDDVYKENVNVEFPNDGDIIEI